MVTRKNEKTAVVGHQVQAIILMAEVPADPAITRCTLPGGGGKAQKGDPFIVPGSHRLQEKDFGKARGRNPSKAYGPIRRRGFRPITQSKIFFLKSIIIVQCSVISANPGSRPRQAPESNLFLDAGSVIPDLIRDRHDIMFKLLWDG